MEDAATTGLTLLSWRSRAERKELATLLAEHTGMRYVQAAQAVDRLREKDPVRLEFVTPQRAARFRAEAEALGVVFEEPPFPPGLADAQPADYLDFVNRLCALSPALRAEYARQRAEWKPRLPLPTLLLADLGRVIATEFPHADAVARRAWFQCIEQGFASSGEPLGTEIATGLLEGLWHTALKDEALAAQVLEQFGTASREYIDAYDALHGIYR